LNNHALGKHIRTKFGPKYQIQSILIMGYGLMKIIKSAGFVAGRAVGVTIRFIIKSKI
jgi:hypothetical protein